MNHKAASNLGTAGFCCIEEHDPDTRGVRCVVWTSSILLTIPFSLRVGNAFLLFCLFVSLFLPGNSAIVAFKVYYI